jgi:hypothetical protein
MVFCNRSLAVRIFCMTNPTMKLPVRILNMTIAFSFRAATLLSLCLHVVIYFQVIRI